METLPTSCLCAKWEEEPFFNVSVCVCICACACEPLFKWRSTGRGHQVTPAPSSLQCERPRSTPGPTTRQKFGRPLIRWYRYTHPRGSEPITRGRWYITCSGQGEALRVSIAPFGCGICVPANYRLRPRRRLRMTNKWVPRVQAVMAFLGEILPSASSGMALTSLLSAQRRHALFLLPPQTPLVKPCQTRSEPLTLTQHIKWPVTPCWTIACPHAQARAKQPGHESASPRRRGGGGDARPGPGQGGKGPRARGQGVGGGHHPADDDRLAMERGEGGSRNRRPGLASLEIISSPDGEWVRGGFHEH